MKKILIAATSVLLLCGCAANTENTIETPAHLNFESVEKFEYKQDTSVKVNTGEKEVDVTSSVVNYKNGEIYVDPTLFTELFDMKEETVTEEEKEAFTKEEKENGLASPADAPFIKLKNAEHTIILREGTKLYYSDGKYGMLESVLAKTEDGIYSCSFSDIVLNIGYESYGVSIVNNTITYTLY